MTNRSFAVGDIELLDMAALRFFFNEAVHVVQNRIVGDKVADHVEGIQAIDHLHIEQLYSATRQFQIDIPAAKGVAAKIGLPSRPGRVLVDVSIATSSATAAVEGLCVSYRQLASLVGLQPNLRSTSEELTSMFAKRSTAVPTGR
jgi:hypothetical protein